MSAETANQKIVCSHCGHTIKLNAWGVPVKHQSGDYMDAITRAREKLKKELGFGLNNLKERGEYETNKKRRKKSK